MSTVPAAPIQVIPLHRAVLCLDCQVVYETAQAWCPQCAGIAAMPLAPVLNRVVKEEEGEPIHGDPR